jgi:hypothetical protein
MGPTRKELRMSAVVPIRINGINEDGEPIHCIAHTLNVSRRGARIAGVNITLRLGVVVRIIRGRANAAFKVVWLGDKETNSMGQIGVEALEVVSNFWGLEQLKPVSQDEEQEHSTKRRRPGAKK